MKPTLEYWEEQKEELEITIIYINKILNQYNLNLLYINQEIEYIKENNTKECLDCKYKHRFCNSCKE